MDVGHLSESPFRPYLYALTDSTYNRRRTMIKGSNGFSIYVNTNNGPTVENLCFRLVYRLVIIIVGTEVCDDSRGNQ